MSGVLKLLNVRWSQTLKFTGITSLVPFSTPTRDYTNNRVLGVNAVYDINERQRAVTR